MICKIGKEYINGEEQPVYDICGRSTRDAETKTTQSGKTFATVGIAARRNQDGTTTYIDINGWRDSVGPVSRIVKGQSVRAVGVLRQREYNGRAYFNLDAEWVSVSGGSTPSFSPVKPVDVTTEGAFPTAAPAPKQQTFADALNAEDPGELPF